MTTTNRWLREEQEHSSLSNASLGKVISTGLLLGVVHILTGTNTNRFDPVTLWSTCTHKLFQRSIDRRFSQCFGSLPPGPDHLSALAAMTTGSSWRAFALGIRWGCGHSIGLIFMALIFFAAGRTVDLHEVGGYLNYAVGFFMMVLGVWTAFHERKKYRAQLTEDVSSVVDGNEGDQLPSRRASQSTSSAAAAATLAMPRSQQRSSSSVHVERPSHVSISSAKDCAVAEASASPSSSFHPLKSEDDRWLAAAQCSQAADTAEVATRESSVCHLRKWICCRHVDFEKPTTQKVSS